MPVAGAAHVDRAQRVCLFCNSGALGDERHLIFECAALTSLWSRYANLFTGSTDTTRSLFLLSENPHMIRLSPRLSGFQKDLNMFVPNSISDRPCWLAEVCNTLLLLEKCAFLLMTS